LLATKRVRKNRFRKKNRRKRKIGPVAVLKFLAGAAALTGLSLGLIFCHDLVTQLGYFQAETVAVTGNRHLPRSEILSIFWPSISQRLANG